LSGAVTVRFQIEADDNLPDPVYGLLVATHVGSSSTYSQSNMIATSKRFVYTVDLVFKEMQSGYYPLTLYLTDNASNVRVVKALTLLDRGFPFEVTVTVDK
jgi:hypothetical protein